MQRRAFLASSALVLVAGCTTSGTSAPTVTATAAADLKLIADACLPLATAIAGTAGVSPGMVVQINVDVAQLEAAAAAVQPGVAVATAVPSVSAVATTLSHILAMLDGFALPAGVTKILTAVQALLPLVEAAVGIAVALAARPATMTPEQARAVLAAGLR